LQIPRAADLGTPRWGVLRSQTEQRLKGCHRRPAAIVPKHELVEINLELSTAHAVPVHLEMEKAFSE
jgi:hypothetical protein